MMYLKIDTLIDERYRIDEQPITTGGMQYVYPATDVVLERKVALKTPKNDAGLKRFERSARLSAKLNHENVTRTLDYIDKNDEQYLIEEFVDGMDLGQILKRVKRFDPYLAATILHALARALHVMHAQNVVHRDLKPSNIMAVGGWNLTGIKVTDFGVANLAEAEVDRGVAGGALAITGSKTLIGALPYLAPEILRKRTTISKSADIWAVGALAYHFIAGQTPFGYELEAVTDIVKGNIRPLPEEIKSQPQYRALYEEIDGIARACMQVEPVKRPDAAQLLALCEKLCYPIANREVGTVTRHQGVNFAFATNRQGNIFFHIDSVLGSERPRIGGEIWFSRHLGSPNDRAHPVVPLLSEDDDE